jgi:hypothetical protein
MEETGMLNLRDHLISQGVENLGGWSLTEAFAISADGLTIVGTGTNPQGSVEAWVAIIPEPSMVALGTMGVFSAMIFLTTRRRQSEAGRRHAWRLTL